MAGNVFERSLPDGMTAAQYGVINRLVRTGADETITDLARAFRVTQPTMSSTVRQLEDKGYVRLQPAAHDGRQKLVSVTASARRMRERTIENLAPVTRMLETAGVDWERLLGTLTPLRHFIETHQASIK